jgi:hypothetical protein
VSDSSSILGTLQLILQSCSCSNRALPILRKQGSDVSFAEGYSFLTLRIPESRDNELPRLSSLASCCVSHSKRLLARDRTTVFQFLIIGCTTKRRSWKPKKWHESQSMNGVLRYNSQFQRRDMLGPWRLCNRDVRHGAGGCARLLGCRRDRHLRRFAGLKGRRGVLKFSVVGSKKT